MLLVFVTCASLVAVAASSECDAATGCVGANEESDRVLLIQMPRATDHEQIPVVPGRDFVPNEDVEVKEENNNNEQQNNQESPPSISYGLPECVGDSPSEIHEDTEPLPYQCPCEPAFCKGVRKCFQKQLDESGKGPQDSCEAVMIAAESQAVIPKAATQIKEVAETWNSAAEGNDKMEPIAFDPKPLEYFAQQLDPSSNTYAVDHSMESCCAAVISPCKSLPERIFLDGFLSSDEVAEVQNPFKWKECYANLTKGYFPLTEAREEPPPPPPSGDNMEGDSVDNVGVGGPDADVDNVDNVGVGGPDVFVDNVGVGGPDADVDNVGVGGPDADVDNVGVGGPDEEEQPQQPIRRNRRNNRRGMRNNRLLEVSNADALRSQFVKRSNGSIELRELLTLDSSMQDKCGGTDSR